MSSPQPGRSPGLTPPQEPSAGTLQAPSATVPMPPAMRRYGLALLSTAVAFFVRWLLNPALEAGAGVFLPFICANVISSWYGGLGPGLLATGLGACLAYYAFLPPPWSWTHQGITSLVYLALFLVTGAAMSVLQAQLRRARQRAEAEAAERKHAEDALRRAHDELEQRVLARTSQLSATNAELRREITGRQRAEEALRRSEERFRRSFELGLIGMAMTSPTKEILEVNDELCRLLGYERSKLRHKTWAEMTHPDDLAADVAQFNRVMAGEIDGYSLDKRWIRKDGRVIDTIMAAKCLRRADGAVDYFVGLIQDITDRKRTEEALHKARAALAHVTRVMTMGELMASIAHEVNQPLGAIVTNSQASLRLLARESPDLEKVRDVLARVISDGLRASAVITRMRALVKRHDAEQTLLNGNEIIHEVLALIRPELSQREIHLQTALAADLPLVRGDRVQLRQVLLNLILNAQEAMSGAGWQPRALCITSRAPVRRGRGGRAGLRPGFRSTGR